MAELKFNTKLDLSLNGKINEEKKTKLYDSKLNKTEHVIDFDADQYTVHDVKENEEQLCGPVARSSEVIIDIKQDLSPSRNTDGCNNVQATTLGIEFKHPSCRSRVRATLAYVGNTLAYTFSSCLIFLQALFFYFSSLLFCCKRLDSLKRNLKSRQEILTSRFHRTGLKWTRYSRRAYGEIPMKDITYDVKLGETPPLIRRARNTIIRSVPKIVDGDRSLQHRAVLDAAIEHVTQVCQLEGYRPFYVDCPKRLRCGRHSSPVSEFIDTIDGGSDLSYPTSREIVVTTSLDKWADDDDFIDWLAGNHKFAAVIWDLQAPAGSSGCINFKYDMDGKFIMTGIGKGDSEGGLYHGPVWNWKGSSFTLAQRPSYAWYDLRRLFLSCVRHPTSSLELSSMLFRPPSYHTYRFVKTPVRYTGSLGHLQTHIATLVAQKVSTTKTWNVATNKLKRIEPSIAEVTVNEAKFTVAAMQVMSLDKNNQIELNMVVSDLLSGRSATVSAEVVAAIRVYAMTNGKSPSPASLSIYCRAGDIKKEVYEKAMCTLAAMNIVEFETVQKTAWQSIRTPMGYQVTDGKEIEVVEDKTSLAYGPALIANRNLCPVRCKTNAQTSISGRITDKKNPYKGDHTTIRMAREFAELFHSKVHYRYYGIPEEKELYERQTRMTQIALLDEGKQCPLGIQQHINEWLKIHKKFMRGKINFMEYLNRMDYFARMFNKAEFYDSVKDPRIITVMIAFIRYYLCLLAIPLGAPLKETGKGASGKTPIESSRIVAGFCNKVRINPDMKYVCPTDWSRFDGTISPFLRKYLDEVLITKFVDPKFVPYMLEWYRMCHSQVVKGANVAYDLGTAQASGDPLTSVLQTYRNMFLCWYTLVKQGKTAEAAWDCLGVYSGDDGLTADMLETKHTAELGMKIDLYLCKPCATGKEYFDSPVVFLSRIYMPEVWYGETHNCCDLTRALPKIHCTLKTQHEPSQMGVLRSKSLLCNDHKTPIIKDYCNMVIRAYAGEKASVSDETLRRVITRHVSYNVRTLVFDNHYDSMLEFFKDDFKAPDSNYQLETDVKCIYPFVDYWCTKNGVVNWKNKIAAMGRVNSRKKLDSITHELVLHDNDSLKVKYPAIVNGMHLDADEKESGKENKYGGVTFEENGWDSEEGDRWFESEIGPQPTSAFSPPFRDFKTVIPESIVDTKLIDQLTSLTSFDVGPTEIENKIESKSLERKYVIEGNRNQTSMVSSPPSLRRVGKTRRKWKRKPTPPAKRNNLH